MKAAIVHRGGKIREPRAKETIGFDNCVRKCVSNADLKCLTEEEALTIQIINSLRDAAQHYILDISEQQLYIYAQAGLTLFGQLLQDVFHQKLNDHFPDRVLPVSTSPPNDFAAVINAEFADVKELVLPGSRKRLHARAKLRSLAIVEASLSGIRSQPGENELGKLARRIADGEEWPALFPGVASLRLDTEGTGFNVSLRITKSKGDPVHLVPEGTPGTMVVAVKRVDELGFYSLGLSQLADKLNLTQPKTLAVIRHLKIQKSSDYFKEIKIGKSKFKRYSPKALDLLKHEISNLNINKIWEKHRPRPKRSS
ncbi:hypothetical protein MYX82_08465 [Acidobacteria bacterium AH-259-D05]|nr:hypothetical protein [Acidobacteria bacterium AH-259-D05]